MNPLVIIGIAVGLAMDAFAVALSAGLSLRRVSARQFFRMGFHFGLFQAMMPVLGWWAGYGALEHIQAWDHWVVFGLLAYIGGKAVHEALKKDVDASSEEDVPGDLSDPTRGLQLVTLSVATSLDALAAGFSFSMLGVSVWYPSLVIGVVTAGLTVFGMALGSRLRAGLGRLFGRTMEIVGGVILIGIGVKVLVEHLSGA